MLNRQTIRITRVIERAFPGVSVIEKPRKKLKVLYRLHIYDFAFEAYKI
jgi:hypothetical protein